MYIDLSMLYICVSAPGMVAPFYVHAKACSFFKSPKMHMYSVTIFADASPIVNFGDISSNLDLAAFFLKGFDVLLTTYEMIRNDRAKFSDRETICFSGA